MSVTPPPSTALGGTAFRAAAASRQAILALGLAFGGSTVTAAFAPGAALAHAIIVSAQPAMNSTVAPGALEIRLAFNTRIDAERSRLSLARSDGSVVDVALKRDGAANVLAGNAFVISDGRWRLRWLVLSLDGHITRGEVDFFVRDVTDRPR